MRGAKNAEKSPPPHPKTRNAMCRSGGVFPDATKEGALENRRCTEKRPERPEPPPGEGVGVGQGVFCGLRCIRGKSTPR